MCTYRIRMECHVSLSSGPTPVFANHIVVLFEDREEDLGILRLRLMTCNLTGSCILSRGHYYLLAGVPRDDVETSCLLLGCTEVAPRRFA